MSFWLSENTVCIYQYRTTRNHFILYRFKGSSVYYKYYTLYIICILIYYRISMHLFHVYDIIQNFKENMFPAVYVSSLVFFSCKQIPILNRKKKTIVHHTFVHCDFLQNINELVQNIKYYAGLEKNTFPAAQSHRFKQF